MNLSLKSLMKIDIQAMVEYGIGGKEVKLLIEQVKKCPSNVNDLEHTVKNFHAILVEIFTQDSIEQTFSLPLIMYFCIYYD